MNLTNIIKPFSIMLVFALSGCSSKPNDYKALIDAFEEELAYSEAEDAIEFATNLASQDIKNVNLPTFMSYPIPAHYKEYHKSLGIDVTKLNYTQEAWIADVKKQDLDSEQYESEHPKGASIHDH